MLIEILSRDLFESTTETIALKVTSADLLFSTQLH